MKTETFRYLDAQDWDLLLGRARKVRYQPGDRIVEEGKPDPRVLIVERGFVRIERETPGGPVSYARVGKDEVLGEMSFLESRSTTASAVADTEVEVTVVDEADLHRILDSNAEFASRFYRSLAVSVSARLRETAGALAATRGQRRTRTAPGKVPAAVTSGLEKLKGQLTSVELTVLTGDSGDGTRRVIQSLDVLQDLLFAHLDDAAATSAIDRACYEYLQSSRTITSCAGAESWDPATLDLIEAEDPDGSAPLGGFVDAWFLSRSMCHALQARAQILSGRLVSAGSRVTLIGAVGRGLRSYRGPNPLEVTLIDSHPSWVGRLESTSNVTIHGFVAAPADLAPGSNRIALDPQDLIYASVDFLSDESILSLLGWSKIRSRGEIVLVGLDWQGSDRAVADHLLKWKTYARTPEDLEQLGGRAGFDKTKLECVARNGNLVLSCRS